MLAVVLPCSSCLPASPAVLAVLALLLVVAAVLAMLALLLPCAVLVEDAHHLYDEMRHPKTNQT